MRELARNLLVVVGVAGLLLLPAAALANSVRVNLDAEPETSVSVLLDLDDGSVTAEGSPSSPVLSSSSFALSDQTLFRDGNKIADAAQLLAQAKAGDVDIVIYRAEHNSWANPLRVIAGHPKQVSRVFVRAYRGDRLLWSRLMFKGAYSYDWQASFRGGGE